MIGSRAVPPAPQEAPNSSLSGLRVKEEEQAGGACIGILARKRSQKRVLGTPLKLALDQEQRFPGWVETELRSSLASWKTRLTGLLLCHVGDRRLIFIFCLSENEHKHTTSTLYKRFQNRNKGAGCGGKPFCPHPLE